MHAYLARQKKKTLTHQRMVRQRKIPVLIEEISEGDPERAATLQDKSYAELVCIRHNPQALPGTNWWDGGDDGPRAA